MIKSRIFSTVAWLAFSLLVRSETYYVATNGVDSQSGIGGWANAVLTISNAVAKAITVNDLVLVSNGEYLLTAQITVSSQITVRGWNNGVVATNWMGSTNTIVNGNAGTRCFTISHTGAVVEGLTIYKGNGSVSYGGGVYMSAGTLRNCIVVSNSTPNNAGGGIEGGGSSTSLVDNCLMAYNTATNGGGIWFYPFNGGAMLVTNCVIRNNRAFSIAGATEGGGGVWMRGSGGSTAILANCSVYWNEASYCGGGIMEYGACVAKNCMISNNFNYASSEGGGGVYMYYGLITNCVIITNVCNATGAGIFLRSGGTIANCRIIGNQMTNKAGSYAAGGVGLYSGGTILNSEIRDNFTEDAGGGVLVSNSDGGILRLRNCLIAGNMTSNGGGGVYLRRQNNVLENCTIVSNRGRYGGGLAIENAGTNFLANCIIYFNTVSSGSSSNYYYNAAGILGSYSNCCLSPEVSGSDTNYSTNNITVDPQFKNWQAGNYRMVRGSPCINTGVNRDWMTNAVDLDGKMRIRYGRVDIGAYERIYEGTFYKFH